MGILPVRLSAIAMSFWNRLPKVRQLRNEISIRCGDSSVVEIGCAFGHNAQAIKGDYLGLDYDQTAIDLARSKYSDASFEQMDTLDLPLEPGSRDIVLFALCVHELPGKREALKQAIKVQPKKILVFDFNPNCSGWDRFRVNLLEDSGIDDYWSFDLPAYMNDLGWDMSDGGEINSLFSWWEFSNPALP